MTPSELHRWARPHVLEALEIASIDPEPLSVVQGVQAIGWIEAGYGTTWKHAGVGSNNWGAIQDGRPPCDEDEAFLYVDTHPNPDGTSSRYEACFRKYKSPAEGALHLVRQVYGRRPSVVSAARAQNFPGISAELFHTHYFEGFGATPAERIANHYKRLFATARAIAAALEEPIPGPQGIVLEPWHHDELQPYPTLRRGSRLRSTTKTLQRELNEEIFAGRLPGVDLLVVDGMFGPLTEETVANFQAVQRLKIDGVVGGQTWHKLIELAA